MQRRICRIIGACGLIVSFSASGYGAAAGGGASAGGAAAAGGGAFSGAAASGGTARAAGTTASPTVGGTTAATGGTVGSGNTVGGTPGATGGTVGSSTTAGGTSGATGGNVGTTTTVNNGALGTTLGGTSSQLPATTTPIPGQVQANGVVANTTGATIGGGTSAAVPFTSLPQTVQSSIVNQIPAGAQLGQVIQETAPNGTITYRAQIMQNGIVSEVALNGSSIAATTAESVNRLPGTASTINGIPATTGGGVVVGTPYSFETLPTGVQSAFTSQAGGTMVTNVTYVAGANGAGIYRGFVNGRPVDVRVGANGQILPGTSQLAIARTTTATNEVKIDDLPMAVRDSLKKSMPFAEVTRIRQGDSASGKIYDVTLRDGTETKTIQVAEDGTVVREDGGANIAIAETTTAVVTNEAPKLTLSALPVLVRDTIDTRVPESKAVRMLVLTNFNGKTAYAVDYLDKDALRNRLMIGKDGVVVGVQTNIYGITQPGHAIVVADMPAAARSTVQTQMPEATITRVDLAQRRGEPIYVVTYISKDGEQQQMVVSGSGERLDAMGSAATAESGQQAK